MVAILTSNCLQTQVQLIKNFRASLAEPFNMCKNTIGSLFTGSVNSTSHIESDFFSKSDLGNLTGIILTGLYAQF